MIKSENKNLILIVIRKNDMTESNHIVGINQFDMTVIDVKRPVEKSGTPTAVLPQHRAAAWANSHHHNLRNSLRH